MNAKVIATFMFALLPNLALAESGDQTRGKTKQSDNESAQGSPAGKNGNGSDANGAATPGGAESDANAISTIVKASVSGAVNKTVGDGEHLRAASAH